MKLKKKKPFQNAISKLVSARAARYVEDAKEAVRGLASAALAAVGDAHAADALLPALLRSLDFAKAPRAKTGVLEFALYVLSGQAGPCPFSPPQSRALNSSVLSFTANK